MIHYFNFSRRIGKGFSLGSLDTKFIKLLSLTIKSLNIIAILHLSPQEYK